MGNLDPRFYGGEPIWNTAERQGVRTASFYWVGSEVPLASGQPSIWKPFDKSVSFSDRADSVISWSEVAGRYTSSFDYVVYGRAGCDRSFRYPGFLGNLGCGRELG